ncbi:RNase adapter RapZ [Corynebacterium sp. sy017]|uniref:RNase adapter RapZ n=1 Tax=unclassified Corynebacterium TaxID=2624378 RepID=UPI001186C7A7|nr:MULTISPECIES: RNase adapter RapZ [unclassified Corynebacterium]MBP3087668.1 RNase adapter RapZ [Corynebacterium sp. sy017]TSD92230.1 RNase adapter RapZ [Corynebacterium sp. SY003]
MHSNGLTNEPKTAIPPVIVTGLSGAGLSSAARVLEDMGWYVVQNLPPQFVVEFLEKTTDSASPTDKIALVCDVRSLDFHGTLEQVIQELAHKGLAPLVLYMDARDDVLIKRFDNLRRTHPLQGSGTLQVGINREREIMSVIKETADVVIDSSDLSVHDLRRAIEANFSSIANKLQHVTVQSFGFKHGSPRDTDIMVDVRFLPNPFWVPELRPFRGVDKPVADYVLAQPSAQAFLDNFESLFGDMRDGFKHEGKNFITISIGCTGGHHRSVAIAEELGRRFREQGDLDVTVIHRDIENN